MQTSLSMHELTFSEEEIMVLVHHSEARPTDVILRDK